MELTENQKLKIIRFTYWLGAIMDGFFAIDMTIIALLGVETPLLTNIFTEVGFLALGTLTYRYAMGLGGALMWGWTVLLIWADQEPIKRRGVLLITLFPVIIGIFINNIMTILNELVTIEDFLLRLLVQIGLMILFVTSYLFTRKMTPDSNY